MRRQGFTIAGGIGISIVPVLVLLLMAVMVISNSHKVEPEETKAVMVPNESTKGEINQDFSLPLAVRRVYVGVTIHHSATAQGSVESMHAYHLSKGWDGIGYHFVIGNGHGMADGEIQATFRWTEGRDGAHCKGHNDTVGICLVGDFTEQMPSEKQIESLRVLLELLREQGLTDVKGHSEREGAATLCPGPIEKLWFH